MAGVLADDLGGLEQGGAHIGQVLGAQGFGLADEAAGPGDDVAGRDVVERVGGDVVAALFAQAAAKTITHAVQ